MALVFAAVALSACVTVVERPPRHVPPQPRVHLVPAVEGLALDHARAELEEAGYRLGRVSQERHRHAPAGSVLWQDPEPHTRAPRGSHVDLVVAERRPPDVDSRPYLPDLTSVPDLHGLELRQARRALKRADLRLGDVTKDYAKNRAPGTVIWQGPAPTRRVKPGSTVNVVVARAKPNPPITRTTVPKLRGLSLEEARARLRQAELRLGEITEKIDNGARRGTVIGQRPKPTQAVRPGTPVDVVVSRRQPHEPIAKTTVPKLRGLPVDKARARLRQADLRLGKVTEQSDGDARRGTVIAQTPAPKQQVRPGTAVDLVVAAAEAKPQPAGIRVPDLRGQNPRVAAELLERSGLQVGKLLTQKRGKGMPGTILDQSPDPGTVVQRGASIDLVVLFHAER